jgi:hypothetical protein
MKWNISITATLLLILCIIFLGFWVPSEDSGLVQEIKTPIIINANLTNQQTPSFRIYEPLIAYSKYSLCFQYNTTGLASPSLSLADSNNLHEIHVDLPRNTWGLGDACLKFQIHYNYSSPQLTFINAGDKSTLIVKRWALTHSVATPSQVFDRPIIQNQLASVYIENNYLKKSFWAPLAGFILLWLGSGLAITSLILNLNKMETVCIAPITGAVAISFCAYFLSLLGIYKISLLIFIIGVLSLYTLYIRYDIQSKSKASPASNTNSKSKLDKFFDLIAALLIGYMMYKYIFVAFAPFYATWDGLVSWNKWGEDWSLREMRGNYQFTYPQLIPLFYSAYYKLSGFTASNPLALEMNSVHFFITCLGLLALPLLYLCSKALNIATVIPVSILLLCDSFFAGISNGFVDNALVSYYLVCILLILKAGAETNPSNTFLKNSSSMLVMIFIAAGAIFIKQTGIFASVAIALFIWCNYRKTLFHKTNIFLMGLLVFVPVEFYFHEIVLDIIPSLVEDNPLNHSIGGVISNAATQLQMLPTTTTWYGHLTDKLAPSFMAKEGAVSFLSAVAILGVYVAVAYKLFHTKRWRYLLIWAVIVGGLLLMAMKFGVPGEGRYVLLKWPAEAIFAGVLISWLSMRSPQKGSRIIKIWVSLPLILVSIYHLYKFIPLTPNPSVNGFDMISYETRLGRFFHPAHVRVADYLVSQSDQSFRFFTESDFVVWPNTIYDGFTKSTPTKMADVYQPGDYYYSMFASDCPKEFSRVNLDVGAFVFCVKK